MSRALVLIDLQADFLAAPGLRPAVGPLLESARRLLDGCRHGGLPVFHVRSTVSGSLPAMPHWQRAGRDACREDTPGWQAPAGLEPRPGERLIRKSFYSAFEDGSLQQCLQAEGIEELWFAGVHGHACVRASLLDAYARGYRLFVADDALASDDPLAAELARDFLRRRAVRFLPVAQLLAELAGGAPAVRGPELAAWRARPSRAEPPWWPAQQPWQHVSPRYLAQTRFWLLPDGPAAVADAAAEAAEAGEGWRRRQPAERAQLLLRLADRLEAEAAPLADRLVEDIGKPVQMARAELARSVQRLRLVAAEPAPEALQLRDGSARRRSLGSVALITPWNHALGIVIGKLAGALSHGNAVLWKPALPGAAVAGELMRLLKDAGMPAGLVGLLQGGADTARALMDAAGVDAVSLTGGAAAGVAAAARCARRLLPLQLELGGNNAALVMPDCDLGAAAASIAWGAFGFAGQRCTANRRAVVSRACLPAFLEGLQAAVAALAYGDPRLPETVLGPMISRAARERLQALLSRSATACQRFDWAARFAGEEQGAYHPPVVALCEDAAHELVQEESFAPLLVVQPADDFEHALALAEEVPQGLAAALFSADQGRREIFARKMRAGLLKFDQATTGAGIDLPFGGWKASGFGPPQHGPGNQEFYGRWQATYQQGP